MDGIMLMSQICSVESYSELESYSRKYILKAHALFCGIQNWRVIQEYILKAHTFFNCVHVNSVDRTFENVSNFDDDFVMNCYFIFGSC